MRAAKQPAQLAELPDAELVSRIVDGDRLAFELMMRRHNQMLFRTARSILRDDSEAEDALQDAYILAYRAMPNFRGDAKLSTWLTRIVVNEAIARSRKRQHSAEVIRLHGEYQHIDEVTMTAGASESPERAAMRLQTRKLLEQSIDSLPEAFRSVFVLRTVQEMSGEEVAACLGITEATVRTRLFRAKSLLREALSREIDFAFEEVFAFDGQRCDRIVATVLERLQSAQTGAPD
jgi:RNA polymerase sigma-70 factor (ECF subfamily)